MDNKQDDNNFDQIENKNDELKFFNSWKKILQLKYLVRIGYGLLGITLFYLLMDKAVLPIYTKHGEEIRMPDVTNMPFEEAEKILKEKKLRPILDHKVNSMAIPGGYVISQNPLPDAIVKSNRRTYLIVSKGEKWIRVPKLVGGSERDALLKLRQVELVPGRRISQFSSIYPRGVVSNQSIAIGDSARVGDTVDIEISRGDMPMNLTVPKLIGKSLEEAKKILLDGGFEIGLITYRTNNDLLPDTVIQQSVQPESIVDVGTEVDLILSQIEEKYQE